MLKNEISFCQWMISRTCNNKCAYCEVQTTESQIIDIQHSEAVKRTFQLLDGKTKRLEFIGGEPLDYPLLPTLISLGNQSSIERLVIITTAINEKELANTVRLIDSKKWGLCFTLDIPEKETDWNLPLYNKHYSELSGAMKKSKFGWQAFRKYSKSLWLRGHVTIGSHNIADVPKIARQILESGAFFNCCPIIYSRKGHMGTPFMFRSIPIPKIALSPEDKSLTESVVFELIKLKEKFGELFLPSEEYLKLIPLCCKKPKELYPACCGNKMPYLRLGDRVAEDGTFEIMTCSDLYLERGGVPKHGLLNWFNNQTKVEDVWKKDLDRRYCQITQGCVWSVSLTLKNS